MRNAIFLSALLTLASCSGNGISGGNDMATNANPDLLPGPLTQGLSIGPIPLAPGEERTVCTTKRLTADTAINVVEINSVLAPGSHHLIFYKSMATVEAPDIADCQPLDLSNGDIPVYIAETQNDNDLPLPPGVAYKFDKGQMIRLEAHYINATPNALMGMGSVTLTEGDPDPSKYQTADIMFCGSVSALSKGFGTGVVPGMSSLPAAFYKPPTGVKVFAATTHEHKRGSGMTLGKATSASDTSTPPFTMGMPYDNPPFVKFPDPGEMTFAAGEGFRWQCSYNNTSQMTYYFGQSAQDNEMCFFWAYYYPSVGHFISPMSDLGTCGQ